LLWWRSRGSVRNVAARRAAESSRAAAERRPNERKLLREVQSACTASDADAARVALLEWAEARFAPDPPRSLGALASELPEPAAAQVLDLEAHIYGVAQGRWDGRALGAAFAGLDAVSPKADAGKQEPLLPLYR